LVKKKGGKKYDRESPKRREGLGRNGGPGGKKAAFSLDSNKHLRQKSLSLSKRVKEQAEKRGGEGKKSH